MREAGPSLCRRSCLFLRDRSSRRLAASPSSLFPLAELCKGAASPVTWQPRRLSLIGSPSRQAAKHTRPARPRPEGRAQPLHPGAGHCPGRAARPCAYGISLCFGQRLGATPAPHPRHRTCSECRPLPRWSFRGFSPLPVRLQAVKRQVGAGAIFRTTPSTLEKMAKRRSGGRKEQGRSNSEGESSTPALGEAG